VSRAASSVAVVVAALIAGCGEHPPMHTPIEAVVERIPGNEVDNYHVQAAYHSIGMNDTPDDARFGLSLGHASIGFDTTRDGRRCRSHVHLGGVFYTDIDGDGRFDARDGPGEPQISVSGRWITVGRVHRQFDDRAAAGIEVEHAREPDGRTFAYVFEDGRFRPTREEGERREPGPGTGPGSVRDKETNYPAMGPEWTGDGGGSPWCHRSADVRVERFGEVARLTLSFQRERIVIDDAPDEVTVRTRLGTMHVVLSGIAVRRAEVEIGSFRYVDTDGDGIFEEATDGQGGRPIPPG
jgi:hypothetical protein